MGNVYYDESKELFAYNSEPYFPVLRNEQLQLVDTSNFEEFKQELYDKDFKYQFELLREKSDILKQSDWKLASVYEKINQSLNSGDYNGVFVYAREAKKIYPDMDLYSDLSFLEGYAFENLGLDSLAKDKYIQFLNYSEKKYSGRQRGYEFSDIYDSMYISQRKYSKNFVFNLNQTENPVFRSVPPKHHYNSFQPGFSLADEEIKSYRTSIQYLIGFDMNDRFSVGMQLYKPINITLSIFAQGMISDEIKSLTIGAPTQLFKSFDNGIGLKITPFMSYLSIKSLNGSVMSHQEMLDFGWKLSAGYFIAPNLSLGAYYKYHYYNEWNKFQGNNNLLIWNKNEYDVSAYFNLMKEISFKTGIKNSDIVVGFLLSGLELSYAINGKSFIIRSDIF